MGAIDARKEACRDARGLALVDSLRQDLTYALRALRKSPGFSAVAILSLAIGIGANTTIFTFVNAVLLEPLPYPGSERLVTLNEHTLESGKPLSVHPVTFVAWRARARSFETLALTQSPPLNVMGPDGAEQLSRLMTTGELFQTFGVSPALGRNFTEDELRPRGAPVVILGHGFWHRRFGADPAVLGRQLTLPDGSLTIVGVGPPGFRIGVIEPEVFTPLEIDPANPAATGSRAFQAYGRLAAGTSLGAAQAEMSVIAAALRQQERAAEGMDVFVSGLRDFLVRDARSSLQLLMAVVATVLVIGCVNLAGLLLARGLARRGEPWPPGPSVDHRESCAVGARRTRGSHLRSVGDPGPCRVHCRSADVRRVRPDHAGGDGRVLHACGRARDRGRIRAGAGMAGQPRPPPGDRAS
jgi:predicted permease